MFSKFFHKIDKRRWASNLVLLIVVWAGVTWWQTRDLIPTRQHAASFELYSMQGDLVQLESLQGRRVMLYFFAPWCTVCSLNIGNLNWLRELRSETSLAIYAVALDYQNPEEVLKYAAKHDLQVPVLFGRVETLTDYRIQAFPTLYVIDENGLVDETSVGYTPLPGLWWRSL